MELLESVRAAVSGSRRIFRVDPQDYASRGPFIDLLRASGKRVVHHDSIMSMESTITESELDTPSLHVVPWDTESLGLLDYTLCCLSVGSSILVMLPAGLKDKVTTKLRALAEPVESDQASLSPLNLKMRLQAAGFESQTGVPQLLSQLAGDDFCHYMNSLKVLRSHCGSELTLKGVAEVVERMPDPDGRELLSDLLHQRTSMLPDRLEDIGPDNYLGLYRAVAHELGNICHYATMLDDDKKPDAIAESMGVTDPARKDTYLQQARRLGSKRLTLMLDIAGRAVTLLQTTPHDRDTLALYFALRICSI